MCLPRTVGWAVLLLLGVGVFSRTRDHDEMPPNNPKPARAEIRTEEKLPATETVDLTITHQKKQVSFQFGEKCSDSLRSEGRLSTQSEAARLFCLGSSRTTKSRTISWFGDMNAKRDFIRAGKLLMDFTKISITQGMYFSARHPPRYRYS